MDYEAGNHKIWGSRVPKDLSEGASTHVYAAFSDEVASESIKSIVLSKRILVLTEALEHNGSYLVDCQCSPLDKIRAWGRDSVEAKRLWKLSEELVGQKFEF